MHDRRFLEETRGSALLMALLISIAIAAMALGAIMLANSAQITTTASAREATLEAAANGGLEIVRDSINHGSFDSLVPDSGYTTLVSNGPVLDAFGNPLPGLSRSLYIGRTGGRTGGAATAGQYGSNFASALSVVTDFRGDGAVRRLLMTQESWTKYAVAVNNWSGTASYGCDESVFGPFFSNTGLILSGCSPPTTGTVFRGPVSVVGSITNEANGGIYLAGVQTGASPIPWPTPARIAVMRQYAQDADAANGDYDITSPQATLGTTKPAVRIEFVTIDVNGDGVIGWDEGFMRVWVAANTSDSVLAYATGRRWPTAPGGGAATNSDPNMISRNCGAKIAGLFTDASDIYNSGGGALAVENALTGATGTQRGCFLGGDPHLFAATGDTVTPDSTVTNNATFAFGWWQKRRTGPWGGLTAVRPGDRSYLIPLGANPNFKGVIFVQGDVALSGQLRGRVTVVATGNVVMADDLHYYLVPGSECDAQGDMLGAIATKSVIIEDDNLQTPFFVTNPATGTPTVYGGFDDTGDANYNGFLFAVGTGGTGADGTPDGNWYGEGVKPPWIAPVPFLNGPNVDASAVSLRCFGATTAPSGCVRVTGGIAMARVDNATNNGSNFGWKEEHAYDPCGAVNPPPYFPTTGRFIANRLYEIDPVWLKQLTVGTYFQLLQSQ